MPSSWACAWLLHQCGMSPHCIAVRLMWLLGVAVSTGNVGWVKPLRKKPGSGRMGWSADDGSAEVGVSQGN